MLRLGLCCIFVEEPIKFRTTTAAHLKKFARDEQLLRINEICLHNVRSLAEALGYCYENRIGDFRIQSGMMPLRTHPDVGYDITDLPDRELILNEYRICREFALQHNIRTSFHPDQFIILSSPQRKVTENSIKELLHQAEMAELTGADIINIHCGGVYGDKKAALLRLEAEIEKLPSEVRSRLTLENDDRSYTPDDVIPVCRRMSIPFVYDVHHHRCLSEDIKIAETTDRAISTWNREPMFHISSPKEGWDAVNRCYHNDYIQLDDFPAYWKKLDITVEIEAKAKELAISKLLNELLSEGVEITGG